MPDRVGHDEKAGKDDQTGNDEMPDRVGHDEKDGKDEGGSFRQTGARRHAVETSQMAFVVREGPISGPRAPR